MLNRVNKFLDDKSVLIFVIFLYLQPVMDIMTGVMLNYFNSSFVLSFILKMLFLIFMVYYTCFIKKKNIGYFIVIFIYCLCFILTNLFIKGSSFIFVELETMIKVIYLPVSFAFVSILLKERDFKMKHLYIILGIYMLFIFVPNLFHLGFKSYSYAKLGSIGLFYSANAIGSILSFLLPIMISFFINKKLKKIFIIFLIIYLSIILKMGTKIPIVCIIFVIIYYLILIVVYLIKNNKKRYLTILFLVLLMGIIFLIKLLPKFINNLKDQFRVSSFGIGILSLIIVPILLVLMLVLRVTSTLAFAVLALFILVLMLSMAITNISLAKKLEEKKPNIKLPIWTAIITAVTWVVYQIPVLGGIVAFIWVATGLGMSVRYCFSKNK